MNDEDTLHNVNMPTGNTIRLTVQQWAHIVEGHDYMAGNMDKVLETLAEPSRIVEGQNGEALALRDYESTNITKKTSVVVYRNSPNGFVITAFFTSKPHKVEKRGRILWMQ